ncbi:hypothetical protein [Halarchaeum sp. P4]|uniref:hypothetical protein n=1 Tax=Halarchaeum sp. P4 TaxID=3421639 RepID=UPI003EB85A4C
MGVYGGPLAAGAAVVGWLVASRGNDTVSRRFWALASVTFAVAHLLSIPTIWALFVLLD